MVPWLGDTGEISEYHYFLSDILADYARGDRVQVRARSKCIVKGETRRSAPKLVSALHRRSDGPSRTP